MVFDVFRTILIFISTVKLIFELGKSMTPPPPHEKKKVIAKKSDFSTLRNENKCFPYYRTRKTSVFHFTSSFRNHSFLLSASYLSLIYGTLNVLVKRASYQKKKTNGQIQPKLDVNMAIVIFLLDIFFFFFSFLFFSFLFFSFN